MVPFTIPTSRPAVLTGLALGLTASLPVHAQVHRCSENGRTTYFDHPYGTRAKSVPLTDSTPSAAGQRAVRERANTEAAEVQQMETACREAQAAGDVHEAQVTTQATERAHRGQRQKVVVAQEGVRCCHRVYVGPLPYPQPYPMPMPVIRQPPTSAADAFCQPSSGPEPFAQTLVTPTPIVPRPPYPHYPYYRIVCEPDYAYEESKDLLLVQ